MSVGDGLEEGELFAGGVGSFVIGDGGCVLVLAGSEGRLAFAVDEEDAVLSGCL